MSKILLHIVSKHTTIFSFTNNCVHWRLCLPQLVGCQSTSVKTNQEVLP